MHIVHVNMHFVVLYCNTVVNRKQIVSFSTKTVIHLSLLISNLTLANGEMVKYCKISKNIYNLG